MPLNRLNINTSKQICCITQYKAPVPFLQHRLIKHLPGFCLYGNAR